MMTRTQWWVAPILASCWLAPAPANALSFTESSAFAEASESGQDEGTETDGDESSAPGGSALAEASRCPGNATCAFPPNDWPPHGGRGYAETNYGSNRASSYAAEGYAADDDSISNSAGASSFWADEWTFDVAPSVAGQAVTIDIHLDGFWRNGAWARYEAGVGQRIVPAPEPDPEAPPSFLLPDVANLTGAFFESTSPNAVAYPPVQIIVLPDGDQSTGDGEEDPDGSVDIVVTLSFVPEAGATYVVQARLDVRSNGRYGGGESHAGFDSTASFLRVVVPDGISFTSAAGASYNVEVPEPGVALLVGTALLALARRGRTVH